MEKVIDDLEKKVAIYIFYTACVLWTETPHHPSNCPLISP